MSTKIPKNKAKIIGDISRDQALVSGDITTALNKIGQLCAKTLKIEEVTFWQFTQNGENLTCIASHKAGKKNPTKAKQVSTRDIKDYIKAKNHSPLIGFCKRDTEITVRLDQTIIRINS